MSLLAWWKPGSPLSGHGWGPGTGDHVPGQEDCHVAAGGRRGPPTGYEGAQTEVGFGAMHTGMCVQKDVTGLAPVCVGDSYWYLGVG